MIDNLPRSETVMCMHVSKCYHTYSRPIDRLRDGIGALSSRWFSTRPIYRGREFWALKDITFNLLQGETVGIVGRNGSGKSTLLQLIAGTLNPSGGEIRAAGRVSALLELGAGFNPEFTGMENVCLNAALLGLSRSELENQLDSILEFAGIGDHVFMPVKTYSSGMYVRLAFSVLIHTSPELLIVDEALAVGDAAFQAKCMLWIRNFQKAGGSLLFVSHDIAAVRSLCDRAIYLEHGKIKEIGDVGIVTDHYLRDVHQINNAIVGQPNFDQIEKPRILLAADDQEIDLVERCRVFEKQWAGTKQGTGDAVIRLVEMLNKHGEAQDTVAFNEEVSIRMYVECFKAAAVSVNYKIRDKNMTAVVGADFLITEQALLDMVPGCIYKVEYQTRLSLGPGDYTLRLSITQPIENHAQAVFLDIIEVALPFKMLPSPLGWIYTQVYLPNTLEVRQILPAPSI